MKERLLRGLQVAGMTLLLICLCCLLLVYNEWDKERKVDRASDTVDHATQAGMIVNDQDLADSAQAGGKIKEGKVDKVIETDIDGLLVAPSEISWSLETLNTMRNTLCDDADAFVLAVSRLQDTDEKKLTDKDRKLSQERLETIIERQNLIMDTVLRYHSSILAALKSEEWNGQEEMIYERYADEMEQKVSWMQKEILSMEVTDEDMESWLQDKIITLFRNW
ncbi:MAG: hypothetical protein HFH15_13580 [Ruminococcus sp.]|nr:hypothetical protein [Ruminococcus sp.]